MRAAILAMILGLPLDATPRILVVTATTGYRHESIETAEAVIAGLAAEQGVGVQYARTEEAMLEQLTAANLQLITAVFFVNTTGELPQPSLHALLRWVSDGGTFVGFHSASDTWHGSPDYLEMLGAEFQSHPPESEVSVVVDDPTHQATKELPSPYAMVEEIYSFTKFKPLFVRMLLSLRNPDQPLAWQKSHGRGRVLYTALGHREDVWLSNWFGKHVAGAIEWAIEPRTHSPRRRAVRP